MPLQLRYVFAPSPNPIRASVGGAPANHVDLEVMVSNPGTDPVELETITITIPVGQEGAHTLSDTPNLPSPVYDKSSGWAVSVAGGAVTLTPPAQGLLDSFLFTLPGISVNDTPGFVPLTVVEVAPPAPKVIDKTSYALVKLPWDFPVTDFYADPATLYNLDETVTLYWQCSDQGQDYVYSVHSDSWQPDDCLNGGQCFSCADGQQGVVSPQLQGTTTFSLDVIRTNPDNSRTIIQTLNTTARVVLPSISESSYLESLFSGLLVRLHWLAYNSATCAVELDGRVIDTRAPTDTYEQGYPVFLTAQENPHQLVVIAHAESGSAQSPHIFPNVYTGSSTVSVGGNPSAVAVTPDGTRALVAQWFGEPGDNGVVTAVNLSTLTGEGQPVAVGPLPASIAVSPDGSLAFVPSFSTDGVTVIDLAAMKPDANKLAAGSALSGVAFTPDGTLALVTAFNDDNVAVVDVAARQVEAQKIGVGTSPAAVAVTPDGARALVANQNSGDLSVIDVAGRSVTTTVPLNARPVGVAVTPDGKFALVACGDDGGGSVLFVELDTLNVKASVQIGSAPTAVAVTPDGTLALVASTGSNSVTVIDVPTCQVKGKPFPVGQSPTDLAVTPDGQTVITANSESSNLTIM